MTAFFLPPAQCNITDFLVSYIALVTKLPPAGLTSIKLQAAKYGMPFWFQHLMSILIAYSFWNAGKT